MHFQQNIRWGRLNVVAGRRCEALVFPPGEVPEPFNSGSWSAGWDKTGGLRDAFTFRWEGVRSTVMIETLELSFTSPEGGGRELWSTSLGAGIFPPSVDGSLDSPMMETGLVTTVSLVMKTAESAQTTKSPGLTLVGQRFAGSSIFLPSRSSRPGTDRSVTAFADGPSTFDVLVKFPRSRHKLWSNQATLRQSPYFETLLSSGFSEAADSSSNESDGQLTGDAPFDDSDDEADAALPKPAKSSLSPSQFPPHKTVTITETSYSTYLAVVCWLQCGYIDFAPLTSSFLSPIISREQASQLRLESIRPPSTDTASSTSGAAASLASLHPVSPKSVYRLSHLLELRSLSSFALTNFTSQLTISSVVLELFTETSACYDEMSKATLDFVMKNLKEVLASQAMKDVRARAESGELEAWESRVWAMFAMRLGEKAVELEGK
jgi:hypothetical protein